MELPSNEKTFPLDFQEILKRPLRKEYNYLIATTRMVTYIQWVRIVNDTIVCYPEEKNYIFDTKYYYNMYSIIIHSV